MHIPGEAWLPLPPPLCTQAGCTLELMHSGEARSLGFQESRDETNNLHKPSDWIQPAGCHAATSGLEVKCRFSQTWGQMLALPLVTRVTLDKSLHLSGLLCFAGRMTPPGGCCGNEMRQGSQHSLGLAQGDQGPLGGATVFFFPPCGPASAAGEPEEEVRSSVRRSGLCAAQRKSV